MALAADHEAIVTPPPAVHASCVACESVLLLSESSISMPCPHSIWLCTVDLPADLVGRVTVGPFRRPSSSADHLTHRCVQRFRTPRLTDGLDCHFQVDARTEVLWNADLSFRLVDEHQLEITHCMRNLCVMVDGVRLYILRGTIAEIVPVAGRPRFISVLAPDRVVNKPGPCRLLGLQPFDQSWLMSEPFQFFTHPKLNPALSADAGRGILVGTRPAVAGHCLRDVLVARNVLQCTRCRHVWPLRGKHDTDGIEAFIQNCGVFGLVNGHLQPVVELALAICEFRQPDAQPGAHNDVDLSMREAHALVKRWRRLPFGGAGALELPGVCVVVGDLGLLDHGVVSDLPLVSRYELQSVLVHLRCLDEWQPLPHAELLCFRHLRTQTMLYTRTNQNLLFFAR